MTINKITTNDKYLFKVLDTTSLKQPIKFDRNSLRFEENEL